MNSSNEQQLPACVSPKRLSLASKQSTETGSLYTSGSGMYTQLKQCLQKQEHTNWCWAACSATIGNFYHPTERFTQEQIVPYALKMPAHFCTVPLYIGSVCNVPHTLDDCLYATGTLKDVINGVPAQETLRNELTNNFPFALRIDPNFDRPSGHFVICGGFDYVSVDNLPASVWYIYDPWYASVEMIRTDRFPAQYKYDPNTAWTHTYYTLNGNVSPALHKRSQSQ